MAERASPRASDDHAPQGQGIVTRRPATRVRHPLGAHVAQLVAALRAQGHGDLDHSALFLLVEQLSGRSAPGSGAPATDREA